MPDPSGPSGRKKYGWNTLAGDAAGGVVSALIALPYGLAMARQMGLPAAFGLYTSILTAPITAVLGRNPVLIGGTASATLPFIAACVRAQGIVGAAKVCVAASVFLIAFGVFRLGRQVAKVPHAVVSGFSCGVGAMMIIHQLQTLLGLSVASSPIPLRQLAIVTRHLSEIRIEPLVLGAIVILAAAMAARRWPRSPAPLVGVVVSVAVATLLGWHAPAVGAIAVAIPPIASFRWEISDIRTIGPDALGLAFVAGVNILITSRVVEHFRGRHKHLHAGDADAELRAYGVANLFAGMFATPMSVGIPARSLANVRCGGTTRISNLLHAAILLALVWFGSGVIALIPLTALAGVTAFVGLGLLEWSTWRRLPRMRRVDASAFLATAVAVVATNAIVAVAIGCSLYVARYLIVQLVRPIPVGGLTREVDA